MEIVERNYDRCDLLDKCDFRLLRKADKSIEYSFCDAAGEVVYRGLIEQEEGYYLYSDSTYDIANRVITDLAERSSLEAVFGQEAVTPFGAVVRQHYKFSIVGSAQGRADGRCCFDGGGDQAILSDVRYLIHRFGLFYRGYGGCTSCKANWAAAEHDLIPNCPECGGFAAARKCPEGNDCAHWVRRDIDTSNQQKKAAWFDGCQSRRIPEGTASWVENDSLLLKMAKLL